MPKLKRIFLSWLPYSSRSETMAKNFHAQPVYFRYLSGGESPLKPIFRYIAMTFHTILYILFRRPRLVFVMNQPVFLPLTLFLLSRFTKVKYVIDSHSGLFNKPEWKWSLPLVKYAYRHSLFSIVTNQNHRELTESWGAKVEVLGALMVGEEEVVPFIRTDKPSLVVIGTFAADEPTVEIIEACRKLPNFQFYITGALRKADPDVVNRAPTNVTFTDFISRPQYVGLVQAMDGAIILVKHDDVMQRGAYEAMSWRIPIITSDWQILRQSFPRGTIFVDNSPQKIASAVKELIENLPKFKYEISELNREQSEAWTATIRRINDFIERMI